MSININPIETYVPTIYVNNSEPDLDETNLNHAEQALKRVTDAANAAILALESLDSAKIDAAKIVNNLLATDTSTVLSGPMGKALGDRLTAAENLLTRLNSDWMNLTPYLVNNWEGNGKVAAKKIGNCWIVTLAVRNGVTETGTKILDNLPMSIFGTCVNCYYSVRELHGEAIQAVGNHIKLVQAAPSDSMFANFICSM
ncbi:hypothetical protein PMZ73_13890 [[Clostridium] symbiosum]|nr:hypothetical protein [[Clostridium] symbiosum]MDB1983235.1 hypothetical protein [[Clostridium] symbiosum]